MTEFRGSGQVHVRSLTALHYATAVLIGFTGLFGGAAHYATVLAGRSKLEVERATALGFFFGFGLGTFVLAINALT